MKKLLFLAALASLATVGSAQKTEFSGPNLRQVSGGTPTGVVVPATIVDTRGSESGTEIDVDIAGVQTWDLEGDGDNIVVNVPVPLGASMNGVGWDTVLTTVGLSWGSEATMGFSGDAAFNEVYLNVSSTGAPVAGQASSSGGVIKLADVLIPDINASNGDVNIEFFETFDDVAGAADATFDSGTVTIQYTGGGPAVPTVTQWGLIVTTVLLFAGVVYVSMRRKSAANIG